MLREVLERGSMLGSSVQQRYATRRLVRNCKLDPGGIVDQFGRQGCWPLDHAEAVAAEVLAQRLERRLVHLVDAVEVDVVEREPPAILVRDDKRRAVDDVFDAE